MSGSGSNARRLTVLGSTGSIGRSTLDIVRTTRGRFRVTALAAGTRWKKLLEQIREFRPTHVAVSDREAARRLREALAADRDGKIPVVIDGEDAAREIAALEETDLLVNALVGSCGLLPTLAALERGTNVAIANKETLVVAGELVIDAARRGGATLLPLDSELSAIHQCLRSGRLASVKRVLITASGGPFRDLPREEFVSVVPEDALRHPTWDMGPKITVDCATMMNKGLEVIETHFYFGVPYERLEVLVHPQSIVHSLVEFVDGSCMAQLSQPDMRLPIQYALTFPERLASPAPELDLARVAQLTFEEPDLTRFPCLRLAVEAGRAAGLAPAVLNAANEVAVDAFLEREIPFPAIPVVIEECLARWDGPDEPGLENFHHADGLTREAARGIVAEQAAGTHRSRPTRIAT